MQNKFIPEKSNSFVGSNDWQEISGGQHHTIARDAQGEPCGFCCRLLKSIFV